MMRSIRAVCFALLIVGGLMLAPVSASPVDEFRLIDLQGNTHRISDYQGQWVVVNYWATWCPPCLEEIPDLVMFHDKHKDSDAVVLGVNQDVGLGVDELKAFADEYFIEYPILPASPSTVSPFGAVRGLPTTYLLDPEGKVVGRQEGPITSQQIEAFIQRYNSKAQP